MSSIFERVCNFLTHSPLDHISVVSVIYQVIEEQPGYPEDELRDLVSLAIDETIKHCKKDNLRRKKLIKIPLQFEVGYEGVCTLRNIEEAKKKESITEDEIKENMRTLKTKLISSKSSYAPDLRRKIDGIEASNLLWWDPLGSRVLSNESDLVRSLPDEEYKSFMEPVRRMEVAIPSIIKEMCINFVENFSYDSAEVSLFKLAHDMNWKENVDTLQGVTKRIFNTLEEVWDNPTFGKKFASSQSEGTYVTDIIVPVIRTTLKGLPVGKSAFVSTAERQSIASKDRRGKRGKRPDVMFLVKHKRKLYELMYSECSRLVCDDDKELSDWVKLWRELNDGMYWTRKGCKIDEDDFGIVGIQIAGKMLHLFILIRGGDELHRLYRLRSVEIPIQHTTDTEKLIEFVETLLLLRNIMVVNLSLLFNSKKTASGDSENSSTVSSP